MVPSVVPTDDNRLHDAGVVVQRWIEGRPPNSGTDWTAVAAELQRLHALTGEHPQRPGCCVVTALHKQRVSVDVDLDALPVDERVLVEAVFAEFTDAPTAVVHGDPARRTFGSQRQVRSDCLTGMKAVSTSPGTTCRTSAFRFWSRASISGHWHCQTHGRRPTHGSPNPNMPPYGSLSSNRAGIPDRRRVFSSAYPPGEVLFSDGSQALGTSASLLSRLVPDRWAPRLERSRSRLISVNRVLSVTFTLLPAVDVADAQAVRLVQGSAGSETSYGDPLDAALAWQAGCAEWIHLVDLDAAFVRGSNARLLDSVIGKLDVQVELSGGTATTPPSTERCPLAARVSSSPRRRWRTRDGAHGSLPAHGERIAVALDVRIDEQANGTTRHQLAARGGTADGGDLWETVAQLDRDGCARYVVTDVSKDGTLLGPNVELYREVTSATATPVIASGGVSSLDDLVLLAEAAGVGANLEGSIVGKALYAGRFTLPEPLEAMRRVFTDSPNT